MSKVCDKFPDCNGMYKEDETNGCESSYSPSSCKEWWIVGGMSAMNNEMIGGNLMWEWGVYSVLLLYVLFLLYHFFYIYVQILFENKIQLSII
jgi:hypothetical protein